MLTRLAIALILLGIVVPAFASQPGDVLIGDEVVVRIRFPAGGMTVEQRADAVTYRINDLLGSQPFSQSDVKVGVVNKEYVVTIGGKVIITADADTAKFNKSTPQQLAEMWAANLRRVIPKAKNKSVR